jgi:DNA-binding winged helix-turn-helix (wHTH) protein/TolB-like protein/Flp pilus assembly protein TadD
MSNPDNHLYEFGPFRLDPAERQLLRAENHKRLSPMVFDLLLLLVQRSGQLVKKEEIIEHLWSDTIVEEGNLTNNVSILRKELGDTGKDPKYIQTVPKHGYRFVAEVKVLDAGGAKEETTSEGVEVGLTGGSVEEETHQSATPYNTTRKFKVLLFASLILLLLLVAAFYFWRERTPAPVTPASIAVLPFKPFELQSGNPSLELGMTDSIIVKLSNISQVTVLPLSAVRRYSAPEQDAIKAGRELGVESVLDGSFQWIEDRIRVRVSLVRVSDGKLLWAEQFDQRLGDIFSVQDAISERVAAALELKLAGNETRQLRKRYTENTDAFVAYSRGRYFWGNRGAENLKKAVEEFNKALALDDKYALAFAGLADCYTVLPSYGVLSTIEAYPQARDAATKALELDNTIPEAHAALGRIKANYDWDWPRAEAEFKRAIELNPNYSSAHYFYALNYLVPTGKLDEAAAELRRVLELEQFSLIINTNLGVIFYYQGRYDEAIQQYRRALELDSRSVTAHLRLIDVYTETGRYDEALAEQELIVEPRGTENPTYLKQLKEVLRQSGPQGYWRKRFDQAMEKINEKAEYVQPTSVAGFAARLGDNDQAFEWLKKAYVQRDEGLTRLKVDPRYKNLRADPRYADLLRRINLGPR